MNRARIANGSDTYGASTMQLNTPSVGPMQMAGAVHSAAAQVQLTVPPHPDGIISQP